MKKKLFRSLAVATFVLSTVAIAVVWMKQAAERRELAYILTVSGFPELPASARNIETSESGDWLLPTFHLEFTCDPQDAVLWVAARVEPQLDLLDEECLSDPRENGVAHYRFEVSNK